MTSYLMAHHCWWPNDRARHCHVTHVTFYSTQSYRFFETGYSQWNEVTSPYFYNCTKMHLVSTSYQATTIHDICIRKTLSKINFEVMLLLVLKIDLTCTVDRYKLELRQNKVDACLSISLVAVSDDLCQESSCSDCLCCFSNINLYVSLRQRLQQRTVRQDKTATVRSYAAIGNSELHSIQ